MTQITDPYSNKLKISPLGLLFACVLLVGLSACHSRAPASLVLRRGLSAPVTTLDAQRAADFSSYEVLRDLGEGLTCETANGEVEPGAASDWSVSPDGLHYRFVLRPSARWSNGDPLVAEDFVAGLRRAVDPKTAAPMAGTLAVIGNASQIIAGSLPAEALAVRALDAQTLTIDLTHPAPYLTALLAGPVAFPVHRPTLAQFGSQYARAGHLVSNGAYRLAFESPGSVVRLERNAAYWAAANVAIQQVEFVPAADPQAELTRYRAGGLDMTAAVPAADFLWLREHLGQELQVRPQVGVFYFAFNLTRPPFNDQPILRQAMALSLDRELLAEHVLKAGQVPAYSLVPPGIGGYEAASYGWSGESVESRHQRAQQLYKQAGFSPSHPLKVRLLYTQSETIRNLSIAAAAQWTQVLGAQVELDDLEFRSFVSRRTDRSTWDILFTGWNADYPDPGNFLELFRNGDPQNDPNFHDSRFEALLDQALAEPNPQTRLALYTQAEQALLASYAITPVYFTASRRLVKPNLLGASLSPMNHNYSKYLSWKSPSKP